MEEETIAELVLQDYRKADVFKKFGIDFCCGGKKTLAKVCLDKGIDLTKLKEELYHLDAQPSAPSQDFSRWDLDFFVDYIINTHHKYVKQNIPTLLEYTQKVARVHGDHHPEVIEIANNFMSIVDELQEHMMKEERILFPYIKMMYQAQVEHESISVPPFGSIENPINMMEMEHEGVGELMEKIKILSSQYTPPAYACNTYRVSYAKLKEFEDDLHQHIHLENNILFPRAIELEKKLLKRI